MLLYPFSNKLESSSFQPNAKCAFALESEKTSAGFQRSNSQRMTTLLKEPMICCATSAQMP